MTGTWVQSQLRGGSQLVQPRGPISSQSLSYGPHIGKMKSGWEETVSPPDFEELSGMKKSLLQAEKYQCLLLVYYFDSAPFDE